MRLQRLYVTNYVTLVDMYKCTDSMENLKNPALALLLAAAGLSHKIVLHFKCYSI